MTLDPILTAPLLIQLHALSAALAIVLGPVVLYRRKRDRLHRALGYVWLLSMVSAALTSFFIHNFPLIGPFSPIHLFAILTLWAVWSGTRHAIARRISAHEATFRNLYWRGLVIAGLFNFMPGRTTNRMFFADTPDRGWIILGLGLALILADILRQRMRRAKRKAGGKIFGLVDA